MTPEFYLTSNYSDPKKETVWICNRRDGKRVFKVANRQVAEKMFRKLNGKSLYLVKKWKANNG